MKRALILGATGMLGHKLCEVLGPRLDVCAAARREPPRADGVFNHVQLVTFSDLGDSSLRTLLNQVRPDTVINAIGIVKQRPEAKDAVASILTNALLPHRLAALCEEVGARLIQVSTDCVFSGRKGRYTEDDVPDPVDLYGRSKLLGEVDAQNALTVRTSIIGRELSRYNGLVEWFLSNAGGRVRGYSRAIFSGLTTAALSGVVYELINRDSPLRGLWHVSSEPLSKYDLLVMLNSAFDTRTVVERDDDFVCDRSLVSDRFWAESGLMRPQWPGMIASLAADSKPYASKRQED